MTASHKEMTEKLMALTSVSQFADHIGTSFTIVTTTGDSLALELISATSNAKWARSGAAREPFSLVFRSGDRSSYFQQDTYLLHHENLGDLALFLVPIGPDDTGMCYQAVFS